MIRELGQQGIQTPIRKGPQSGEADVLTYSATAWDNAGQLPEDFSPFTPDEIEALGAQALSAQQVYERRQGLELGGE